MSVEGIVESLTLRNITLTSLVYNQTQVSVYQGKYQGLDAAVKILHPAPGQDPMALEEESQALVNMQHRAILKVFDFCWLPKDTFSYLVIVTEWCSKDLWKDIENRKTNKFPFEEESMWNITYQLVEAFAYMQSLGYAHQDIKPENIFLFLDKSIRVGDLGSTQYISCSYGEKRIVGTPVYMSPALKGAVASSRRTAFHNVFKSDVYSLGLTLLSMAILEKPVTLIIGDAEETGRVIDSIPYSERFKAILRNMLCEDEEQRGDFKEWEEWLGLGKTMQLGVSEEENGYQVADKPDSPQPSPKDNLESYPIVEMIESKDEEDSDRTIYVRLPTQIIRREGPIYPSLGQRTDPINHFELPANHQDRSRFHTPLYPAEELRTRPYLSQPPDIVEEEVCLSSVNREEKVQTGWEHVSISKKSNCSDIVERQFEHSVNKVLHNSDLYERKAKSKASARSRERKEPSQFPEYEPQMTNKQASDAISSNPPNFLCASDPTPSSRCNPDRSYTELVPDSVKCASCEAEGRVVQQICQECNHGKYVYCSIHWTKEGVQLGCPQHCLVAAFLKSGKGRKKCCWCASRMVDCCKWLLCCGRKLC